MRFWRSAVGTPTNSFGAATTSRRLEMVAVDPAYRPVLSRLEARIRNCWSRPLTEEATAAVEDPDVKHSFSATANSPME
jgi:hypothetical protein